MTETVQKEKIAILGGGVGAVTTAFALTSPDNPLRDRYDITVYQMGWRLGGKGASGRNNAPGGYDRIEEHGIHVWLGFYDNAFRAMRQCYDELARSEDRPLARLEDAFHPYPLGAVAAPTPDGGWDNWMIPYPVNKAIPGDDSGLLPAWEYMKMALSYIKTTLESVENETNSEELHHVSPTGQFTLESAGKVEAKVDSFVSKAETVVFNGVLNALHSLGSLFSSSEPSNIQDSEHYSTLERLLGTEMNQWMEKRWESILHSMENNRTLRHGWIMSNLFYGMLRGIIADGLFLHGFDSINDQNYSDWLARYVFDDGGLTLDSPLTMSIYYGFFGFEGGDITKPNMEAGTCLRLTMSMFLAYKGTVMYKMQAGMGDTVFGPFYEVLKRRGVQFKFFHQVEELLASEDGSSISSIRMARQVALTPEQEANGGYEPLIDVKGLPCWPSYPLYEQLEDGARLKAEEVDLEDYCNGLAPVEVFELKQGEDFDKVVLGISVAALPYLCKTLVAKSEKWATMLQKVKTVRTQALQLWQKPTAKELGWELMRRPLVSYAIDHPLNTWGDFSYLLDREGWSGGNYPLNLAYFCGPMLDEVPFEPTGDLEADKHFFDQPKAHATARVNALQFLREYIHHLWPEGATKGDFHWDNLVVPGPHPPSGEARLDSQYVRGNVQPTERYVLSVKGSSQHRLPAHDDEEFTNLYLTGDWTRNRLNAGCVEAAVISGLLCSGALSGFPEESSITSLDF